MNNKEIIYKKFPNIYVLILLAVIVFTVIMALQSDSNYGFNGNSFMELSKGWTYSTDDGQYGTLTIPENMDVSDDVHEVTISRTLPSKIDSGSVLVIYSSFQNVKCTIGGMKVLSYDGAKGFLASDVPATRILFVNMKSSYKGKKLVISYSSSLQSRNGVINEIYLGDRTDIIYQLVKDRFVIMSAGMFLIFIGLMVFFYRIFSRAKGLIGQAFLYQGICIFLMGVFFVLQTGMNQLFFQDINWGRFVEFFSIMMIPIVFLLEVDAIEKRAFALLADISCLICIIVSFIECYMVVFMHKDYMKVIQYTYISLVISIFFAVFTLIHIMINDKNKLKDIKWMIYSFVALVAGGIGEIILFYVAPSIEDCRMMAYGVILNFYCTLRWVLEQVNVRETQKERSLQQAAAKSEFLANMSHEIRTPINSILGLSDMIIKEEKNFSIRKYANDMKESGEQLLSLINNILDYSKLESGKMNVSEADYNLDEMLQVLLNRAREELETKSVRFITDISEDLPSVLYGDEAKLSKIIWNMLDNAVKYTTSGFVKISVSAENQTDNSIRLMFVVKDSGVGMTEETKKRVFLAFNHDELGDEGGLGLGLSTAGKLTKMLGGIMEVKSRRDSGSELTVWINQKIIDKTPIGIIKNKYEENIFAPEANILLVDDETVNLKIITGFLRMYGITADTAMIGYEGLEKAKNKKYDIIFLDHYMPGIDGIETLGRLQESAKGLNKDTPVIMMTAENEDNLLKKYRQIGFDDFISKPMTKRTLDRIIVQYLPCNIVKKGGKSWEK